MKDNSARPVGPDSQVTQDYLKAVWTASEWGGPGASITGLANRMGVVPSTASETVSRLVEAGLLAHEPYRDVLLTEEGRRRAVKQIRRHRILETYLATVLGYGWEEVHEEAEVLEHAISDRLLERLDAALGHPLRDPHGDPIPQADGTLEEPPLRLGGAQAMAGRMHAVVIAKDEGQAAQDRDAQAVIPLESLWLLA